MVIFVEKLVDYVNLNANIKGNICGEFFNIIETFLKCQS